MDHNSQDSANTPANNPANTSDDTANMASQMSDFISNLSDDEKRDFADAMVETLDKACRDMEQAFQNLFDGPYLEAGYRMDLIRSIQNGTDGVSLDDLQPHEMWLYLHEETHHGDAQMSPAAEALITKMHLQNVIERFFEISREDVLTSEELLHALNHQQLVTLILGENGGEKTLNACLDYVEGKTADLPDMLAAQILCARLEVVKIAEPDYQDPEFLKLLSPRKLLNILQDEADQAPKEASPNMLLWRFLDQNSNGK